MGLAPNKRISLALSMLKEKGFSCYLVGGCVRDFLLQQTPKDYDITTNATPEQIKEVFKKYPLVLQGEKHGTVSPVIMGEMVEITTFRQDGTYEDMRHPKEVTFTCSLKEDLKRRDFTINAMAYDEQEGVIDYFEGQKDLENKVIRAVLHPMDRFNEDGLRILRALRFAARLGFTIEENTANAIHALKGNLKKISRERIGVELTGILQGAYASEILASFSDVLCEILPEFAPVIECPQVSIYHNEDVFHHILSVLKNVKPRSETLVYTALFHDVGKPYVRVRDEKGYDHFKGHAKKSEALSESMMKSLCLKNALIKDVMTLIHYHDHRIKKRDVRTLMYKVSDRLFDDLVAIKRADLLAHVEFIKKDALKLPDILKYREEVKQKGLCYTLKGLCVHGEDIKNLGAEGKKVGEILLQLLKEVLKDTLPNEKNALLERAKMLLEQTKAEDEEEEPLCRPT